MQKVLSIEQRTTRIRKNAEKFRKVNSFYEFRSLEIIENSYL
jgi:hypothetical protein